MLGWGGGIRTPEYWYQKPVPYHLATPHHKFASRSIKSGEARLALALLAYCCVSSSNTPSQYLYTAQSVFRYFLALHPGANLWSIVTNITYMAYLFYR